MVMTTEREGLVPKERDEGIRWRVLGEEMKKLVFIAGPMAAVTISQNLLPIISMMMAGQLGELSLSSTATAISLANVTGLSIIHQWRRWEIQSQKNTKFDSLNSGGINGGGGKFRPLTSGTDGDGKFDELIEHQRSVVDRTKSSEESVSGQSYQVEEWALWHWMVAEAHKMMKPIGYGGLDHETSQRFVSPEKWIEKITQKRSFFMKRFGMASALETLCGQAYGAQQYQKMGTQTYTAIISLLIVCIPLAIFWKFTGTILILIGQSPLISHEAGRFITWLIPELFIYAILQPLLRYFQMQSKLWPLLISSVVALCLHVPLCWFLIYKTELGNVGAAVSMEIAMLLNVIILFCYMMYSPSCAKTRAPFSIEVFHGMKEFFSFAIPSAVMICLEWWSHEFIILLAGLLPHPELETSVLSVCMNTTNTLIAITTGFAAAVSTRVSNELGAGNPRGARVAVKAIMLLAVVETTVVSTTLFANRTIFGYLFTNEKEVIDYVKKMAPLLCLNIILDSLQGTLSGVSRGVGWQDLGAYVNLGAFYLVGIPVAALLGFLTSLRGEGLWIGITIGAIVQVILLGVVTFFTNYEKQAIKARKRFEEDRLNGNEVIHS